MCQITKISNFKRIPLISRVNFLSLHVLTLAALVVPSFSSSGLWKTRTNGHKWLKQTPVSNFYFPPFSPLISSRKFRFLYIISICTAAESLHPQIYLKLRRGSRYLVIHTVNMGTMWKWQPKRRSNGFRTG